MSSSTGYPLPGDRNARVLYWSVLALAALFFVNCFTPLRLHYDMLRYFAIRDCLDTGCPPSADPRDYLPYGYTGLLLALSKLHILRSFSVVFINCLYLLGGLYFVRKVFSYLASPLFFYLLVLLNWTIIKFVTLPLSELQYLFFSLAALYAFHRYTQYRKAGWLLMAFLLAGLAFLTRTVAVALLGALCLGLIREYRNRLAGLLNKNKILLVLLVLCLTAVIVFSRLLGLNHYTGVFSRQFREGLTFIKMTGWHFSEWGEISINTSGVKIIHYLPAPLGRVLLTGFGIIVAAGFVFICFIRKSRIPFIVRAYLFCYMLLMFNWPFSDPRFWVPVIPLIAAVIAQTDFNRPWTRLPLRLLFIVYTGFGVLSMAYMTFTSLDRKTFSRTEAAGVYRNEYETHFFGKPLSDTATHADPYVLSVLDRYDDR